MSGKINKIPSLLLFNPVTLVTTLILLIGMVVTGLVVLFLGRDPAAASTTTIVTKIAAPTLTSKPLDPTPSPSATSTTDNVSEGGIGVGSYVQVVGTDGAGLRMRSEPGLDGDVNFTALDSEVFLVIGGPAKADGYTWWRLEAPYDATRSGWSAGDFLSPIDFEDND